MRSPGRHAALGGLVATLFVNGPCRAEEALAPETSTPEVESCVSTHQSARSLQLGEQWLLARDAMTRCSEPACPIAIRSDCQAWLEEIAQTLPTLLVVVERDDGGGTPVRLALDGRSLDLPEQPRPIEVVPGAHRLRFTLSSYPAVQIDLLAAKGEKNRIVRVRFAREYVAPRVVGAVTPRPFRTSSRPVPATTYWLAGGALVSLAAAGGLLASALVSRDAARDDCAPGCPAAERESIRARLLAADIATGAGIVLGGAALYTYLRRPVEVKVWPSAHLGVELTPGWTGLHVGGTL